MVNKWGFIRETSEKAKEAGLDKDTGLHRTGLEEYPYFVQLTNEVIETMFGRKVQETMFDPTIPSMGIKGRNTPAYCCPAGLKRMAEEFRKYPQQYEVNRRALQEADDDFLTGLSMLEEAYNNIK